MEENNMKQLQQENDRLRQENRMLSEKNLKLNRSVEFTRDYIEKTAMLKAIEYIVRTEEYSIRREGLAEILGIPLPENLCSHCLNDEGRQL